MNTRLLLLFGLLAVLALVGVAVYTLAGDDPLATSVDTVGEAAPTPDVPARPDAAERPVAAEPEALRRPALPIGEDGPHDLPASEGIGALTGRVVDGDGLVVPDATVVAFLSGDGAPFRTRRDLDVRVATGPDGRFTLDGLPADTTCGVEVRPPDHAPLLREPFAVGADETLELGDLVVRAGVSVTGVVSDLRTGAELPGVEVELYDMTARFRSEGREVVPIDVAVTDDDGVYRFEHLAMRQYELSVDHEAYIPLTSVLTFVLAMGGKPARQDFALERADQRVEGSVVSVVDGSPVDGVTLRVSRSQPNANGYYAAETTSDERGTFRLDGVPSGRLTLELRDDRWFVATPMRVDAPAADVVVDARPAQWVDVTLVAPPGHELPEVVDATVKPVPGGGGALVPSARPRRRLDVDDGGFRFDGLRHGRYRLEITAADYAVTTSPQFELLRGVDSTSVVVPLALGATIRGRVEPAAAGVRVEVRPSDYDPSLSIETTFPTPPAHGLRTTTDDDGAFAIARIPAEVYVVSIRADGAPPVHLFDVELDEGEVLDLGVVERPLGGSVVGQVLGPDGEPREGTRVLVTSDDHHGQTTSDAAGAFVLDALPPGTYEITATPGAANFWEALRYEAREQVTVSAGGKTRVTLTLTERRRQG